MLHLLNEQIMNAALDAALSEPIDKYVQKHLDMCKECNAKFDWLKVRFSEEGASILRNAPEPKDKSRCLNESQMETLLDKKLDEEKAEILINHVTECPFCLENLRSLYIARKKGYFEEASPYEARMSLDVIRKIFKPQRKSIIIRILEKGLELISGGEISAGKRLFPIKKDFLMLESAPLEELSIPKRAESEDEALLIDREMMSLRRQKEKLFRLIEEIEYRERQLHKKKQRIQESYRKRIQEEEAFEQRGVAYCEDMSYLKIGKPFKYKKEAQERSVISDRIELKDDDRNPLYSVIFRHESPEQASLTAICLSDKIDISDLEIRLDRLGDEEIHAKASIHAHEMVYQSAPLLDESKGKSTAVFSGLRSGRYLLKLTHPNLPTKEFEIEIL